MPGRYGNVNYTRLTKRAFLTGVSLFLLGAIGQLLIHMGGLSVPSWESTLLVDAEILGVVIMLLSPFVFGIVLPLTE